MGGVDMSKITLTETITLPVSGRYASPRNTNDMLPTVYGSIITNADDAGIYAAPCIDTVNFRYCVAGHAVQTTAQGNVVRCFDKDGAELTGFTFVPSFDVESQGVIAYVQFTSDQGDITVQCNGKVDSTGALLENPVSVLEDLLGTGSSLDKLKFATAKTLARNLGYKAAGVIVREQTYQFWMNAIASGFFMDVYTNAAGAIVIKLDTGLASDMRPAAFLQEREAVSVKLSQSLKNLCNQIQANYAVSYESDKRYKEGTRSNYRRTDDGSTTADAYSQRRYGVRKREIDFDWVRDTATINTIQARLVEEYAKPVWIYTWEDMSFRNMQVEKGDHVVFSCAERRDTDGRTLVNQIGKVLSKNMSLLKGTVRLEFLETSAWLTTYPDLWNGTDASAGDGGYFGGERDLERG
jgi:hypothetical protein